jgi:signal transduction histidine kinase
VQAVADELLALAQNALADLRSLVSQLHPVELVDRGLAVAVREHVESVQSLSGLHIDVETAERLEMLPAELQEDLYRIVREALHNVVKHAHATRVRIKVRTTGDRGNDLLLVEVADDGVGLDGRPPRTGAIGLVSMQARARGWGGRMEIRDTAPGCRVEVMIPVALPDGAP